MKNPCIRILCLPDIDSPIGGVKQLYRHVEHLTALNYDAAIVIQNKGFYPSWFSTSASVISLPESYGLGELGCKDTIIVVPETYVGTNFCDFNGYDISASPRVIFNQNAYYTYGRLPHSSSSVVFDFYEHPNVLKVFSVSEDSHRFLRTNMGLSDSMLCRIVNAVESSFYWCNDKQKIIQWMPRKNPDHVQAVMLGLRKSEEKYLSGWRGNAIDGLSHDDVAISLRKASIFLSFGHPEGFGLPVLEAMAAGCWVIGYTGGGASELFRFGASQTVPFGDWTEFVDVVRSTLLNFKESPLDTFYKMERQSDAVRSLYSFEQERKSIKLSWERVLASYFNSKSIL